MGTIAAGSITAFFLFDVADSIDLGSVQRLIASTVPTRFTPKPPAPPYVQYREPPVIVEGAALAPADVEGFSIRLKAFDYGVISVAMTRPAPEGWDQLLGEGLHWYDNPRLAEAALRLCRTMVERVQVALARPRGEYLTEDYLVFAITKIEGQPTAEQLMASHGHTIAQLLRGEREPLSSQERAEVMRHAILLPRQRRGGANMEQAFVYDSEAGVHGALEILEFANSQLLQFRYYDELLDTELARIYASCRGALAQSVFGRQIHARNPPAARALHRRQRADRQNRERAEDFR